MQILTSGKNPLIKDVSRATNRGTLTEQGYAVAEGRNLYDEAIRSGLEIGGVFVVDDVDHTVVADVPVYVVPRALFREMASTETPQGILTLVRPYESQLADVFARTAILLDGIQDPGNAGAIVRATEAFGGSGVVFLKTTVSPFNPKCLRASAGSLFRLPFVNHPDPVQVQEAIAAHQVTLYAGMPGAPLSIEEVDWATPSAIVIGSEGRGVSAEWSAQAIHVRIPTQKVESLNAAVSASVILYEARRRR